MTKLNAGGAGAAASPGWGETLFGAGGWSLGLGLISNLTGSILSIMEMERAQEMAKHAARQAAELIEEGERQANIQLREGQVFSASELMKSRGVDVTTGSPYHVYTDNIYRSGINAANVARQYNRRAAAVIATGQARSEYMASQATSQAVGTIFDTVQKVPEDQWREWGFNV